MLFYVQVHLLAFLSAININAAFQPFTITSTSSTMIRQSIAPATMRINRNISNLLFSLKGTCSMYPRISRVSHFCAASSSSQQPDRSSELFDYVYDNKIYRSIEDVEKELTEINKRAQALTDSDINLNSPKQVANALYDQQLQNNGKNTFNAGTSRAVLTQLANCSGENEHDNFQRDLAALVLQYRTLKRSIQQRNVKGLAPGASVLNSSSNAYAIGSAYTKAFSTQSNVMEIKNENSEENVQLPTLEVTNNNLETVEPNLNNGSKASKMVASEANSLTFSDVVNELFSPSKSVSKVSKIDEYWLEAIQSVTKPSARSLISQLQPSCPMGYDPTATPFGIDTSRAITAGKKGSLLGYVREQKEKYPNTVILTRVGEFYESFGIDAVLLVEHCGLNAMAGKARAGCPLKNIQATLDGLTNAGFRVAVYEEANDTGANKLKRKSKIKNRMLAQIVSPANPTYLYDLVLGDSGSTKDALFSTPSARPYIGVVHSAAGYAIVEVSTEERTARVTERVTAEAVACRLASYPPADPLFYVPSMAEEAASFLDKRSLPFLPSRWESERDGPGSKMHVSILPPSVYMPSPTEGISDIERFKQCIVSALLRSGETENHDDECNSLSHNDFTTLDIVNSQDSNEKRDVSTNPLYVETASQLGLMSDPTIPCLVNSLVPNNAPNPARAFLRRWLLTPPPPKVASSMSNITAFLKDDSPAMPVLEIPPIGKVLSLIRAGQASAQIFREVMVSLESTVNVLDVFMQDEKGREFISSLMEVLRYESGIVASPENLKNRCLDAMQVIEAVVNTGNGIDQGLGSLDQVSNQNDSGDVVPPAFFERNEANWRGRIKPEASKEAYDSVEKASAAVVRATAIDFWGADETDQIDLSSAMESKNPIVQDIFNNLILLRAVPTWAKNKDDYYHPRDRNGKVMRNRYTTTKCQDAIFAYIEACEMATILVAEALTELSETLCDAGHLPAVTQAAHINLILATACQHAAKANHLGWNLAEITDNDHNSDIACRFNNLHPYWMDNSVAVLNSFDLNGLFLLTAPNMSGKSTIMRSAAAAALLTICGFCAPVGPGSFVNRFDSIFVRGASSDVPSENKSAFGAEMGDIAALLRACGDKSLVFVDELGRGTSPEDGTSLAGAVLEEMAACGMNGFFATHLHSILDLPLRKGAAENIIYKRMEISQNDDEFDWTYRLVDGICTDSRALKTAARFGIPQHIISRAEELSSHLKSDDNDKTIRPGKTVETLNGAASIQQPNYTDDDDEYIQRSSLSEIASIVEEMSRQKTVEIPPKWSSPPSFEGSSVVYVLQVGRSFYVGETDALSQRIRQHRSKGGDWSNCSTIAVKVRKGNARNLESRLIQSLVQNGYDVLSVADGTKIKPRAD